MVIADTTGINYLNKEAKHILSIRNFDEKDQDKSKGSDSSEAGDEGFDEDSNIAISDMICFDSVE